MHMADWISAVLTQLQVLLVFASPSPCQDYAAAPLSLLAQVPVTAVSQSLFLLQKFSLCHSIQDDYL